MIVYEDLESVNPRGRVDVLAYRGAEYFCKQLETTYGLSGIWDTLKPHVNQVASEHLGQLELPTEVKVILQLVQANWDKFGQKQIKEGMK